MEPWYSKGKHKPPEGLVQILRQRKREETMTSMLERVRTTQDAMERIHWEEKMEAYPEDKRREKDQRRGIGVKESMTGYDDPREGPKFVRCSISDVVDQIRSDKDERQRNLREKREMARRKRKEQEAIETKELEGKSLAKGKTKQYMVRTIDSLGADDNDDDDGTVVASSKEQAHHERASRHQGRTTALREEETSTDGTAKTNVEHVISQASSVLSKISI